MDTDIPVALDTSTDTVTVDDCRYMNWILDDYNTIKNPDHWAQRAYARNANGLSIPETSEDAVSWCALGVIRRHYDYTYTGTVEYLLEEYLNSLGYSSVVTVNDTIGHEPIVAAFEYALDRMKTRMVSKLENIFKESTNNG